MPKKVAQSEEVTPQEEYSKTPTTFFDYLRFGESYTSLVLGIVVVIISTALLLSFVHNRNSVPTNPVTQESQSIAQISQRALQLTVSPQNNQNSEINATVTSAPTPSAKPTVKPTTRPTLPPTAKPTNAPTVTPQVTKEVAKATVAPTKAPQKEETKITTPTAGEYTVKAGDSLWSIAERQYKSGYNWVDIARANNLSNPGQINVGNKLKLPKLTAKTPTLQEKETKVVQQQGQKNVEWPIGAKITTDSYQVMKGDSLWNIAIRAYGNGYKWVDIARANNLVEPSIIHSGNKLKIPRVK